ncbi:MAG: oxygen-independent coproporphyrinogen III oxidase [Xanthomonadales bacterium]|nr:oxygen-independent coproporphyrinogen III oxidase [Xanthomonadales bacterium]
MAVTFDLELIRKYGGRGPRYTSYPTAVQFHEGISAERHEALLKRSNASERPLSLYVHVPFCHSLCYYCACTKIITRKPARAERYLEVLKQEIRLYEGLMDDGRDVTQLHFGGGTPTYFSLAQIEDLLSAMDHQFGLSRDGNREYSIEIDPRTVSPDDPSRWAELGFNRVSLGVQDFDPRVQQAVNRIQSFEDTNRLVTAARNAGFGSISLDLIYGLPHQTVESFASTLDQVLTIRPERLAVYSYAHLPQMFRAQRLINQDDVPPPDTRLALMGLTIERLTDAGYVYIGMDHFALPGDELVQARADGSLQRNFQGYSTRARADLVGLGMSSISDLGVAYTQNIKTLRDYEETVQSGRLPLWRGVELDDDDVLRRQVINRLMCFGEIRFADLDVNFAEYFGAELEALKSLETDGLVTIESDRISVTDRGQLLLRSIAMTFDRYLGMGEARHSKVI